MFSHMPCLDTFHFVCTQSRFSKRQKWYDFFYFATGIEPGARQNVLVSRIASFRGDKDTLSLRIPSFPDGKGIQLLRFQACGAAAISLQALEMLFWSILQESPKKIHSLAFMSRCEKGTRRFGASKTFVFVIKDQCCVATISFVSSSWKAKSRKSNVFVPAFWSAPRCQNSVLHSDEFRWITQHPRRKTFIYFPMRILSVKTYVYS